MTTQYAQDISTNNVHIRGEDLHARQLAPWGQIHRDHKMTDDNGQRLVMFYGPNGTCLGPWYGPKGLKA